MIAPEGRLPITAVITLAAGVHWSFGFLEAGILWASVAWVAYLFWEPGRLVPSLPLALVAPADGRVTAVRHAVDPWLNRNTLRIGIRLARLGVGPLRSPTEGKVMDYRFAHEAYRTADFCVTSRRISVCHALWIRTDEGDDVVFVVSSRWALHRVRFAVHVGERLGQGQRCGFSYFGTRVDVLAPKPCRGEALAGQRIQAGSTVIATLVHD